MIWFQKDIDVRALYEMGQNTMIEFLGLEWVECGPDFLKARMPVDHRTRQPYGLLHGGASCVLAETLGSMASALVINPTQSICVGIEINANHIRGVRAGNVTGIARPIHLGSQTHVWEIRIHDDKETLICVSRLTVIILPRKDQ